MLENQFIKTNLYRSFLREVAPMPVTSGYVPTYFFAPSGTTSILVEFAEKEPRTVPVSSAFISLNSVMLSAGVEEGDVFDFMFGSGKFSQPLVIVENSYLNVIRYKCNEDAFGFPFSSLESNQYVSQGLRVRMHSPQLVQEDKTYIKANGEVVTLYAKYYREWECETDYLSEEMHNKIVAALSCDEVYINNTRVTKSDKYEIAWDQYDLDCDGVTKLARATFKVRENITQRNSNY